MAKALAERPVTVIPSTRDEGEGLLAPVREGLGAHPSPDLFHPLREIGQGLFPRLGAPLRGTRRAKEAAARPTRDGLQAAEASRRSPERRGPARPRNFPKPIGAARQAEARAQPAVDQAESPQDRAREAWPGISEAYPPFDLKTGQRRPVETVAADMKRYLAELDGLASAIDLAERGQASIDKARRPIPPFLATFVFSTLRTSGEALALSEPAERIILQPLILGIDLRTAATQAPTAEKRRALSAVAETLLAPLRSPDNPRADRPPTELDPIERVAIDGTNLFQRSRSCGEGLLSVPPTVRLPTTITGTESWRLGNQAQRYAR
jgi:hypothetical protein